MSTPCKASSFQICACAVVNATVFGIRWVFIYYPYLIIMKTQLVETFYLGRYRNSDSWMRVGLCLFGFLFLFCSLYQSESWLRNKGEVASHRRNKNVNLSSDAGRCVLKSQSHAYSVYFLHDVIAAVDWGNFQKTYWTFHVLLYDECPRTSTTLGINKIWRWPVFYWPE